MYLSGHRSYAVWFPACGLVIWRLSYPCAQTFLLCGVSHGLCGLAAPAGVAAGTSVCHGYRRGGRSRTQLGVGIRFRSPGGHLALELLGHVVFFTARRVPFLFVPAKCERPSRRESLPAHGAVGLCNFSRLGARVVLAPRGLGVCCPHDSG